jgi:1-phosphofructokinase family hexose kinase
LTPGQVNRAGQSHGRASGKVLNAARAVYHLGGPCKALAPVGGPTGGAIRRNFNNLGIPARWIEIATTTRVCTTLLETSSPRATELVPSAGELTASERAAFETAYREEAAATAVVILIGSLPPGTPADFYLNLLKQTQGRAIIDARGPELLAALAARPFLVKPNREELTQTLGRQLIGEEGLRRAMREMNERGAEWIVVTDGSRAICASSEGKAYRIQPVALKVVNPIGCGDAMAAGIAWTIHQGKEPLEAIRFGVAAAASKVGQILPGVVDSDQVAKLVHSVEIVRS